MILVFAAVTAYGQFPVFAHSWYPKECCNSRDCAPVNNVAWYVSKNGNVSYLIISSPLGKAIIPENFPVRESKDGRIHVCISHDPFGDRYVVCLFMPPIV
jgi:hypothetical protein